MVSFFTGSKKFMENTHLCCYVEKMEHEYTIYFLISIVGLQQTLLENSQLVHPKNTSNHFDLLIILALVLGPMPIGIFGWMERFGDI